MHKLLKKPKVDIIIPISITHINLVTLSNQTAYTNRDIQKTTGCSSITLRVRNTDELHLLRFFLSSEVSVLYNGQRWTYLFFYKKLLNIWKKNSKQ